MDGMSLTSSGQAKVLSFEEFTAAQQGGMMPPVDQTPEIPQEPTIEPEISMDNELEAGGEQDEVTMLDGPEEGPEEPTDEPSTGEPEVPTA